MRKFLSTLAIVSLASSSLLFATGTVPVTKSVVTTEKEGLDEIVLTSLRENNASIYLNGVAPSYEEFTSVRETLSGRKVDPNRSKMRYYRKLDGISSNWSDLAERTKRHNINWDNVKIIDVTHEIDESTTDKLKKEASRLTYLNFSHEDKAFSIVIRSCIKFDSWKCGGKLRFSR
jgi:hypothetical protein